MVQHSWAARELSGFQRFDYGYHRFAAWLNSTSRVLQGDPGGYGRERSVKRSYILPLSGGASDQDRAIRQERQQKLPAAPPTGTGNALKMMA